MNDTVLERPIATPRPAAPAARKRLRRGNGALRWYSILAVLIIAGWYLRNLDLVTPEEGVGYWLGIAGGSLMLLLLLYPLRKRIRFLHRLGATKHWFRMHMIFGLVGPLLILYHSNYQLGSFNSQVAFYCMLLVAGSGIIGRHFYAAIHRGLYGRKTSLNELQKDLEASVEKSHGLAKLMPKLVARLDKLSADLQSDRIRQTIGIRRSLKWTFTPSYACPCYGLRTRNCRWRPCDTRWSPGNENEFFERQRGISATTPFSLAGSLNTHFTSVCSASGTYCICRFFS